MVVLRSTSGLHMGEFDGAEAIAALGFDRRSQQKAVFGDVNAHIRQFLGSGFLKNGSSKFRQTAVISQYANSYSTHTSLDQYITRYISQYTSYL